MKTKNLYANVNGKKVAVVYHDKKGQIRFSESNNPIIKKMVKEVKKGLK